MTKQSQDTQSETMIAVSVLAAVLCSLLAVAQPLALPREFDWRTKGVVTGVKNQGEAGSYVLQGVCTLTSFFAIKTGKLLVFSEAEATDCCNNGFFDNIFDCFAQIGGLCSEASYPKQKGVCDPKSCSPLAKVNGGVNVQSGNETALEVAVLMQPVLVTVDASQPSFQMYSSGVYSDPSCSSTKLDQYMLLVGYGTTQNGEDYWICQNSWGKLGHVAVKL